MDDLCSYGLPEYSQDESMDEFLMIRDTIKGLNGFQLWLFLFCAFIDEITDYKLKAENIKVTCNSDILPRLKPVGFSD
jgi:hypothetical protein